MLFILMIRRTPRSTRPYTLLSHSTIFRSDGGIGVDAAAQRHRDARAVAGRHPARAGPAREAVDSHPGARRSPVTGATTVYPCCHPHDTAMHLRNMDIIPTGPVPGSQRLELLDALRGFALAGVLVANLEAFSLYYFLSPAGAVAPPTLAADRWLAPAIELLVSAKFITLFSIMFGIGFALLMQRIGQSGGRRWYLRRLAVLFLIGLLHSAFWWGDILRSYAVAGLLLLPLARMRPRNLAILGVALMYLPHLPWWQGDSSLAPRAHAYAAALVAFSSEHAATMLRGNHAFDLWWWQSHWRVPASLPGLMLPGLDLGHRHNRKS